MLAAMLTIAAAVLLGCTMFCLGFVAAALFVDRRRFRK